MKASQHGTASLTIVTVGFCLIAGCGGGGDQAVHVRSGIYDVSALDANALDPCVNANGWVLTSIPQPTNGGTGGSPPFSGPEVWHPDGSVWQIEGDATSMNAINSAGEVVGSSRYAGIDEPSFATPSSPEPMPIAGLSDRGATVYGISEKGAMCGSLVDGSNQVGFILNAGVLRKVNPVPTNGFTAVYCVRDSGQAVGSTIKFLGSGLGHAFVWNNGSTQMLSEGTYAYSNASRISNSGIAVGVVGSTQVGPPLACFWKQGNLQLVNAPGDESYASGVNNHGVIVGWYSSGSVNHAFIRSTDGTVRNLDDLLPAGSGWTLERATDINDDGLIVGVGSVGGAERVFLFAP